MSTPPSAADCIVYTTQCSAVASNASQCDDVKSYARWRHHDSGRLGLVLELGAEVGSAEARVDVRLAGVAALAFLPPLLPLAARPLLPAAAALAGR